MSGWSAIHIAADSESVEMVAWLLNNGAMVDAETLGVPHPGRTALHLAVSKRSSAGPEMVKELLKGGARPTVQTRQGGNTPLHYAIDGRSVEIVKALLDAGADPNVANSSGLTPLHKAAAIPGLELVVETLLQGGASPDKKTSVGAVSAARSLSSLKASRALWETYYAVNTSHTALHIATKARDTERTVETLLKGGADATLQDSSGRTPLHIAVVRMEPEVVTKMLIESGCNVNARDRDEKTPLMVLMTAISLQASLQPQLVKDFQASRERLIDVLLSAGADPFAEGKDKESPLSCAKQANLSWALDRLTNRTVGNSSMEANNASVGYTSQKDATETETSKRETEEKPGFLQTQASRWLPRRSKS
jgi:ankyrin repeat protein